MNLLNLEESESISNMLVAGVIVGIKKFCYDVRNGGDYENYCLLQKSLNEDFEISDISEIIKSPLVYDKATVVDKENANSHFKSYLPLELIPKDNGLVFFGKPENQKWAYQ